MPDPSCGPWSVSLLTLAGTSRPGGSHEAITNVGGIRVRYPDGATTELVKATRIADVDGSAAAFL